MQRGSCYGGCRREARPVLLSFATVTGPSVPAFGVVAMLASQSSSWSFRSGASALVRAGTRVRTVLLSCCGNVSFSCNAQMMLRTALVCAKWASCCCAWYIRPLRLVVPSSVVVGLAADLRALRRLLVAGVIATTAAVGNGSGGISLASHVPVHQKKKE